MDRQFRDLAATPFLRPLGVDELVQQALHARRMASKAGDPRVAQELERAAAEYLESAERALSIATARAPIKGS